MEESNLSRDVHEMFYGKLEENQRIYSKMREKKEKQIKIFVEKHGSAPLQRTDEWFLMRNTVIGASELAALVGMSPYQNFESLARKKRVKSNSSYSNSSCWWETIFEDVAVKYAEREFSTNILGTNICVKPPEGSPLHEKHVVSPDGYGIVDLVEQDTGWYIERKSDKVKRFGRRIPCTSLFEFKCPHRRHPKGFVPKHYLPQVWAGLEISPFTNLGVFCEMVIRKCPKYKVEEWGEYDRNYHFNYDWGRELARGVSAVFRREASGKKLVDYGGEPFEKFDTMMSEAVDGKECRIVHSQLYETDYKRLEGGDGFFMTGFFYWKIFRFDGHIVKKNPGFMEKCVPLIKECLKPCTQPTRLPIFS